MMLKYPGSWKDIETQQIRAVEKSRETGTPNMFVEAMNHFDPVADCEPGFIGGYVLVFRISKDGTFTLESTGQFRNSRSVLAEETLIAERKYPDHTGSGTSEAPTHHIVTLEYRRPTSMLINAPDAKSVITSINIMGRNCYRSFEAWTDEASGKNFVKRLKKRGHLTVLESVSFMVFFSISREISMELLRHRLLSAGMESTRYNNMQRLFRVIVPTAILLPKNIKVDSTLPFTRFKQAMGSAIQTYCEYINAGFPPEIARSVLPGCTEAGLVVVTNAREWMHIFGLRGDNVFAHPEIRRLILPVKNELCRRYPELFGDSAIEELASDR